MDSKIKSKIIIPSLYPPLKNKPVKLVIDKEKEKSLTKISLKLIDNMTLNMYKMFYLNDNDNSFMQRNQILKQLVENNEDLFNIELKREKYRRPAPRKKSFKPENIEEKIKKIESKEISRKEKKDIDLDISRKSSFNLDKKLRKESIDLFEANNNYMKNKEKIENQGEEEINDEEGSIVNQEEEFSYDEEDLGNESYGDDDDDQGGRDHSEGGEYL